jgi:uncharacterized delta-60 repeat protein
MKKWCPLLFLFLVICPISTFAQDGTLDLSFDEDGRVSTDFFDEKDYGRAIVQLNDGKIVVAGTAEQNDNDYPSLAGYLENGTLDTNFGVNGLITLDFNSSKQNYVALVVQDDGKFIAGGNIGEPNNINFLLVRHLPDGSFDPSFGNNGVVITDIKKDELVDLKLQPDGKIITIGRSSIDDCSQLVLARYLSNGDLDLSFNGSGIVTICLSLNSGIWVNSLELQSDGKILVSFTLSDKLNMFRFLEDGNLDSSFGIDGMVTTNLTGWYTDTDVNDDGAIMALSGWGLGNEPDIVKFLPDGSFDTSFGTNGIVSTNIIDLNPEKITFLEDGKLLVFGNTIVFEGREFTISRFNADGTIDSSFGSNGVSTSSFEGTNITMQDDGKILGVGFTFWFGGNVNFAVVRFHNGPLGIEDYSRDELIVFPNPSNGLFSLKHSNSFSSEVTYQITDITGKNIQTGVLKDNQTVLDISEAKSGMYFLITGNSTHRLIKK